MLTNLPKKVSNDKVACLSVVSKNPCNHQYCSLTDSGDGWAAEASFDVEQRAAEKYENITARV